MGTEYWPHFQFPLYTLSMFSDRCLLSQEDNKCIEWIRSEMYTSTVKCTCLPMLNDIKCRDVVGDQVWIGHSYVSFKIFMGHFGWGSVGAQSVNHSGTCKFVWYFLLYFLWCWYLYCEAWYVKTLRCTANVHACPALFACQTESVVYACVSSVCRKIVTMCPTYSWPGRCWNSPRWSTSSEWTGRAGDMFLSL